jgi:hypothetical protein
MDAVTILPFLKSRMGLTSSARDEYLTKRIEATLDELENEKGLSLDSESPNHLMFVVDYTEWQYKTVGKQEGMPRHLQLRLHNLMIRSNADTEV